MMIYFLLSTDAVFFAGCTTVLTLAIFARFLIKKFPEDPLFYGTVQTPG